MRKAIKMVLVSASAAIFIVAFFVSAMAQTEPIKLKFATPFTPASVSLGGASAQAWMDEVTKQTNGKVTFQTFWGGALGKAPETITILEKGIADVVFIYPWWTPGKLPLGTFENVFPFGPDDPVVVQKAKRQMYTEFPQFNKDYAKYNGIMLQTSPSTPYQIMSKAKVSKMEDFKGKKISVIGRFLPDWISGCGAVPVSCEMPDHYNMMQTGVTDMDLLPCDVQAGLKIYEQARHQIIINALTICSWEIVMNVNSFNKLPKDVQQILADAGKKMEKIIAAELVKQWVDKATDTFKKNGVTTFVLPEAERNKWASMVPDTAAQWAAEVSAQGYPGWEIVNRYQEISGQLGYKWPRKWGVKK
jgi:TRAP-type transport system periplasmic protein